MIKYKNPNPTLKYMARMMTPFGLYWFYIGDFESELDAYRYAVRFSKRYLIGTCNNVKEIKTKIEWIESLEGKMRLDV